MNQYESMNDFRVLSRVHFGVQYRAQYREHSSIVCRVHFRVHLSLPINRLLGCSAGVIIYFLKYMVRYFLNMTNVSKVIIFPNSRNETVGFSRWSKESRKEAHSGVRRGDSSISLKLFCGFLVEKTSVFLCQRLK